MENPITLAIIIGGVVVIIFLARWLGAWMLRIDEVIELQRMQIKGLKKIISIIDPKEALNDQKINKL